MTVAHLGGWASLDMIFGSHREPMVRLQMILTRSPRGRMVASEFCRYVGSVPTVLLLQWGS
jgi:hypothetical protein